MFGELPIAGLFFPESKDEVAPTAKEPLKSIRYFTESFLADPQVAKPDSRLIRRVAMEIKMPRAILFSPNNERTVFYKNDGMSFVKPSAKARGEESQLVQDVSVFRLDDETNYFVLTCHGCAVDEFFSLVINPIIQK